MFRLVCGSDARENLPCLRRARRVGDPKINLKLQQFFRSRHPLRSNHFSDAQVGFFEFFERHYLKLIVAGERGSGKRKPPPTLLSGEVSKDRETTVTSYSVGNHRRFHEERGAPRVGLRLP